MHNFQLCPWGDAKLMTYCSCGWVGKYVRMGSAAQTEFDRARSHWTDHVRNAPRTFDNIPRRAMPTA